MHEVVGIMTGAVVHDIEHQDAGDELPKTDSGAAPQRQAQQGDTPAQ
jgi:hypothetical protein